MRFDPAGSVEKEKVKLRRLKKSKRVDSIESDYADSFWLKRFDIGPLLVILVLILLICFPFSPPHNSSKNGMV